MGVKKELVSGVFWMTISKYGTVLSQFLVTIILSRILSPEDYGIIGFLYVFIAVGSILVDSGFGQALIQREEITEVDYSSVFYLNLGLGLIIYLGLCSSLPLIVSFYDLPILYDLGFIVFLIIPISAVSLVHNTMLKKDMRFKEVSIITFSSSLISGIIGIWLAYEGFGIYALVYQVLSLNIIKTILLVLRCRWMPGFSFSIQSIKSLSAFSFSLLGEGLLIVVFNNLYVILIGKFYSIKDVGFYNQAKKMAELSSTTLINIIYSVSFPALVKIKDDTVRLREGFQRIINLTLFIIAPVMAVFIVIGDSFFSFVFTDKWLPSVPLFRILCLYGMIFPLHQICTNVLKVLGKGKQVLLIEVLRRVILVLSIVLTISESISILLSAQVVVMFIMVLVNLYFSGKQIGLTIFTQLKNVSPYYIQAFVVALIVFKLPVFFENQLYVLIYQLVSYFAIYFGISYMIKPAPFQDMLGIIRKRGL